jgi:hypothetical protein
MGIPLTVLVLMLFSAPLPGQVNVATQHNDKLAY